MLRSFVFAPLLFCSEGKLMRSNVNAINLGLLVILKNALYKLPVINSY